MWGGCEEEEVDSVKLLRLPLSFQHTRTSATPADRRCAWQPPLIEIGATSTQRPLCEIHSATVREPIAHETTRQPHTCPPGSPFNLREANLTVAIVNNSYTRSHRGSRFHTSQALDR